jgi:protein-tyrosine-phosphatase
MAVNTNKRIPVKWIRDKAKSAYVKQSHCYICSAQVELELHHLHSITHLLEVWSRKHSIDISTDEAILAVRDDFIQEHHVEIYDLVFTLCNRHHVQLHSIYGKSPSPSSVEKQRRWIELQREKHISGSGAFRGSSLGDHFAEFTGGLDGVTKNR